MKTSGLTLQEALQALVDGKCKRVEHPSHGGYMSLLLGQFWWSNGNAVILTYDLLTPEWSLIDPVQEYEEVERVRWDVWSADGSHIRYNYKTEEIAKKESKEFPGSRVIKMTGIDRIPKKEKVTRRVEVDGTVSTFGSVLGVCFNNHTEAHGKIGKLIFEWEE